MSKSTLTVVVVLKKKMKKKDSIREKNHKKYKYPVGEEELSFVRVKSKIFPSLLRNPHVNDNRAQIFIHSFNGCHVLLFSVSYILG